MARRQRQVDLGLLGAELRAALRGGDFYAAWQARDTREQILVVLDAVVAAGHPLPRECYLAVLRRRRAHRDEQILAGFTGHNHDELARRFGLSSRQVRRVVDRRVAA